MNVQTTGELLTAGRQELLRAGIADAQAECDRMLTKLLCCSRAELYLNAAKTVSQKVREKFDELLKQRTTRIPLAHLFGEVDFWKETLIVNEHSLIPRQETEILVEQALRTTENRKNETFSFLDLGTGSGAIAVAILNACRTARGTLADISAEALTVADVNLRKYLLKNRAEVIRTDLFGAFSEKDRWDLIVSNPPYLSSHDMENLQPEIRFEPREALAGGQDGLDFYRKIIPEAKKHLTLGGTILVEVGQGQAETVSKWFQEAGYDNIQTFKDYLQIQRVVSAQRNS